MAATVPHHGDIGELKIVVDDLSGPEIACAALLEEHIRDIRMVMPPQSRHALDLDGLRMPEVTLWTVIDDEAVVGFGAIRRLDREHGEIKSMRVARTCRRRGMGSLLLRHLIAEARRMGLTRLSVETGSREFFAPARRLYLKHGFELCGPFAHYVPDPNSVFLTRRL